MWIAALVGNSAGAPYCDYVEFSKQCQPIPITPEQARQFQCREDPMNDTVRALWPELEWIENAELREKTAKVWEYALEQSSLQAEDLHEIPFTLQIGKTVSFMAHKRSVVHICRESARIMREFYGDALPIDMDTLIAGAILIDVGKLLEYARVDGELVQSRQGKLLRHVFSGVALAYRFDLPPEVIHMIAVHSKEGDFGTRTVEGWIAHCADFMTFEPLRSQRDHLA